jgi:hypothetical protein
MSSGGLPPSWSVRIAEWLASKDQESKRLEDIVQTEQIAIARAASKAAERAADAAERASAAAERQAIAAERANKRATIALIIAIASVISTAISISISHFDANKSSVSSNALAPPSAP